MHLRTYVVFKAKFVDEAIFSDTEDVFRGPGIKSAFILIGALKKAGFQVSHPCERDYYGWVFTVAESIRFVIQHGGESVLEGNESLLLVSDSSAIRWWLGGNKHFLLHRRVLETINDTLKNDERFFEIRWFTAAEYNQKKTPSGHSAP